MGLGLGLGIGLAHRNCSLATSTFLAKSPGPWSRRRDSWSAGSGAYGSEAPVRGRPAVLCPAAVKS